MKYDEIAESLRKRPRAAVATVVASSGSAPRAPGARMVVFQDGRSEGTVGGGILEKKVVEDAAALLATGGTSLRTYPLRPEKQGGIGAECGGEVTVFIEAFGAGPRLLILGGGHIGLELYKLAQQLGWEVAIADDRPAFSSRERFPQAIALRTAGYGDPALRELADGRTAIVIATEAHTGDAAALANLIGTGAFYVGMIGSARKVAAITAALQKEGTPAEKLGAVRAPVGIDIGAETPAEIAVSIFAEILAVKSGVSSVRPMMESKRRGS